MCTLRNGLEIEHAALARGTRDDLAVGDLHRFEPPLLEARGEPGSTTDEVQLTLLGEGETQHLGIPAGARHDFDDGHVFLKAKEFERLHGLAFDRIARPLLRGADIAGESLLDALRNLAFRRCIAHLCRQWCGDRQREQHGCETEEGGTDL